MSKATKGEKSNKSTGPNCLICCEIWRKGENAIKCKTCKNLLHGPGKNKRCSLLTTEEYVHYTESNNTKNNWTCPKCMLMESPFNIIDNNDLSFVNTELSSEPVNLRVCPDVNMKVFLTECNEISLDEHGQDSEDEDEFRNNINSRYYDIHEFNTKTKHDLNSSLRLGHTNIASISKHIDDLHIALSMLKVNFHIIGITEHKIQNKMDPIVNLDLEGFRPFIYVTKTSHGGTGFFISDQINYKLREDLKIESEGNVESTFIELIIPNKKNMIIGCIYRHPNSQISVNEFTTNYMNPILC